MENRMQPRREVRELSLLLEITRILNRSVNINEIAQPLFRAMSDHMDMHRGTLTLLNRETGQITIEEAFGLSHDEQMRGTYKLGEGVTGKVVESGKPIIVPRISQEPGFMDKTGSRRLSLNRNDISFICVPIQVENETIGTISADRLFADNVSYEEDVRLLTIIASLIAQSAQSRQTLREENRHLHEENERLHRELASQFHPSNIIGNSTAMRDVYNLIGVVCKTKTTVLIRGESGTGKELVAGAIHFNSPRANKPYIKVNCAAIPDSLIESELFGHEKGSFTGAVASRAGKFEQAHEGTIFLDEVADLSPMTQVKLLRVLQEREFEPVGSEKSIKVDVRIIAATNRNMEELVNEGKFRADLYYRLNIFPINVPALRERKTDIMLLADFFVERYSHQLEKDVKRISTGAIDMLMSYHWPGNVRELENVIERAVLLSTDGVIQAFHLPPSLQMEGVSASSRTGHGTLPQILAGLERDFIIDALKNTGGNMSKAAKVLGITERIMGLRVKQYSLDLQDFRRVRA